MPSYQVHTNESPCNTSPRVHIDRPVTNQMELFPRYDPHKGFVGSRKDIDTGMCSRCLEILKFDPLKALMSFAPILEWLPKYEWKKDLSFDLVAGFTIAVMHIPQGMAYALLGNLPPIVGIYMAFFPVIVYSILGTSRQVSMGTFAVICLMTGKTALERLTYEIQTNVTLPSTPYSGDPRMDIDILLQDDNIKERMMEIGTAISFAVGIWQVLMGIFRLGSLSALLSTELVSGFTTGAAIHVFTSQIKSLLGIKLARRQGIFKIILTYVDIGQNIGKMNVAAFTLSFITLSFLIVYNELLKPIVSSKISFPIPIELIAIIVGTTASYYSNFHRNYNISIVNTIPTGFPVPKLAPMEVVSSVLMDGIVIGIVAYAISISMCKIFATKHNYPIDPNQELIAEGTSNVVGSFFSCAPIAASLSRSSVQDGAGGRTQLAGIFSALILVFVLLWVGPYFESLPNCVLSGIIVVALKGMFLQFNDLPIAWRTSKVNGVLWVVTFVTTVVLDIEYGLCAGVLFSVFLLLWGTTRGNVTVLGYCSKFGVYADIKTIPQATEMPRIKILKYTGSLNFVNGENFIKEVDKIMLKDDDEKTEESEPLAPTLERMRISSITSEHSINMRSERRQRRSTYQSPVGISTVVFDFSSLSSIDPAALRLLTSLNNYFQKVEIQVLFAGSPATVLHVMDNSSFLNEIGVKRFFLTVHDAVTHVLNNLAVD